MWFQIFVHKEWFEEKVWIKGPDTFLFTYQLETDHAFQDGLVENWIAKAKFRSDPVVPGMKEYVLGWGWSLGIFEGDRFGKHDVSVLLGQRRGLF